MKSKAALRQIDALKIPEGFYVEPYTPKVGRITSASLGGKELAIAKLHINAEATITGKDSMGNDFSAIACNKGELFFPVSEVSSTGGVTCFIIHDGVLYRTVTEDMTAPVYER